MQSLHITFTLAATGDAGIDTGASIFWLMLLALAILDDGDRRETKRRRKRLADSEPRRPAGPKLF